MATADLSKLVSALDSAMGRPPFPQTPSQLLLDAIGALKKGLEVSIATGTLMKGENTSSMDLKVTLAVLATAYPRGSVDQQKPNMVVFEGLLDAVVLAFPLITYTLKDLISQALNVAPRCRATAQLLALTKGFTKENVLKLLYGEGVAEDAVKAPTRPPPKPKKGAPAPAPWAPPPLIAQPSVIAELAEAYANGTLSADCKPFIYDIFVGHCRFGVAVGEDDSSAARILCALFPFIRATLHPTQLLRALSPRTAGYFMKLAEDRPDYAPVLLKEAQSLAGLTSRQAIFFRSALKRFIRTEGPHQRSLGEFITAAVLSALVTRTTKLMPPSAPSFASLGDFDDFEIADIVSSSSVAGNVAESTSPISLSIASPKTPLPPSPVAAGFPVTDALPQLIVSGALGYSAHSADSNMALVSCAEALVVIDRQIGRLDRPVTYDLAALNDAVVRFMDIAMDVSSPPMVVSLALSAVMHLVDSVHNYKNASATRNPNASLPARKQAVALGANMPLCRAVAMALTLDCTRACGKQLRMFSSVWLGHMLRTRSLGLPSLLRCGVSPLFIMPKAATPAHLEKEKKPNNQNGGKGKGKAPATATAAKKSAALPAATVTVGAAHTAVSDSITIPPSVALGPSPKDGMKTLLFKLLQAAGGASLDRAPVGVGIQYLVKMILEQLEVLDGESHEETERESAADNKGLSSEEKANARLDSADRIGLFGALCAVPLVSCAQYIVDEVLDAEDADTNPNSEKKRLLRVLVKHGIYPSALSRLERSNERENTKKKEREGTESGDGEQNDSTDDDYDEDEDSVLVVKADDERWTSFVSEVDEHRTKANVSAEEAVKKEIGERLAAARRAEAEYAQQKVRIRREHEEAAVERADRLKKQQVIVDTLKSVMAQREKEVAEALERSKARRAEALRRVQMLEVERRQRAAEGQVAIENATRERRELAVSLREYLVDTLRMEPSKVYPILSFLRTQIDTLSSDEVHEYLVTGSMSVPMDMTVDVDDDDAAETMNLEEHEVKSRVAARYLRTHEGMDFWGGAIEFAPAEDAPPADLFVPKAAVPPAADKDKTINEPKPLALSYHRRVAPILDAFDFSEYEEAGSVPELSRGALSMVITKPLLDDRGFADLTDALYACSSKGLLKVKHGVVELTPLGAAYHAPFANAERSFRKVFEERGAALKKLLEAKKIAAEALETAAMSQQQRSGLFADELL